MRRGKIAVLSSKMPPKRCTHARTGIDGEQNKKEGGSGLAARKDRGRTRGSYTSVDGGISKLSGGLRERAEKFEQITDGLSLPLSLSLARSLGRFVAAHT